MKRQPPSCFEARTLFSVLTPEYIPISAFPLIQTACSIVWIWQAIWHECEAVVLLGCLLATKTEAKEPHPMGSSSSNSSFQENNRKLSPKTDGNGLGFDFSKEGSLKAMLSLGLQVISVCKHLWNLAAGWNKRLWMNQSINQSTLFQQGNPLSSTADIQRGPAS